jgi:NTE family protein
VGVKLFVSTTDVRSGKIRVFGPKDLKAEVFMASACLPLLFRAVEIDGEHYWDGGYMGNPALFPPIYNCRASDIMLVEINLIRIDEVPTDARAILDRMNDFSFNAMMMREMRAIAFVTRMLDHHRLNGGSNLRRINFHMIEAEEAMARYGASSKFNTDPAFLDTLFALGREATEDWLDQHFAAIGRDSSVDLHQLFF